MSIQTMIAEHPRGALETHNAAALGRAVRSTMLCSAICTSCADACLTEPMDMSQCIRVNLDCADLCQATSRIASRRTGHDRQLVRAVLRACIEACQRCAVECGRHANPHCQHCAQMCQDCAEDCVYALGSLNPERSD